MPAEKSSFITFVIPEEGPGMTAYSTLKADADYLQHTRDEVQRHPEIREDDVSKAEHMAYAMKPMMDMYARLKAEAFEAAAQGDKATVDTKMELADKCRNWGHRDGDEARQESYPSGQIPEGLPAFRQERTPAHNIRDKIIRSKIPLLDLLLTIKDRGLAGPESNYQKPDEL